MRKVGAGLGGLALAAGLATTFALSAGAAAPPDGTSVQRGGRSDELPNPAEEKRRALREVALQKVIAGDAKVAPARREQGRQGRQTRQSARGPVRRARAREDGQDLRDPGRVRQRAAPELPGPGHRTRTSRGRPRSTARCTTRSRRPTGRRTTRRSGSRTTTARTTRTLYFGTGDGVESLKTYYERQSSGRYSVDGQVTDWVKVPYNEARYGRSDGFPCAEQRLQQHVGLIQDAINTWVADQKAAGAHRRADQGRARVLRPVGPQRLRRRRQLQRAPTATSTTSRSSTPAATRPTATRTRARTRSGRTAGRRSRT